MVLTVIDNRDILPADALPAFKSHVIESRLHHIPGLPSTASTSTVTSHQPPGTRRALLPRPRHSPYQPSPLILGVGAPRPLEPAPNSAGEYAREVISRFHGRHVKCKSLNTPYPQLLSFIREMGSPGTAEPERISYSRLRDTSDVAPTPTSHHHWADRHRRAVPGDHPFRYVQLGTPDMARRMARLAVGEDVDFFCLIDGGRPPWPGAGGPDRHPHLPRPQVPPPGRFEGASRTTPRTAAPRTAAVPAPPTRTSARSLGRHPPAARARPRQRHPRASRIRTSEGEGSSHGNGTDTGGCGRPP